MTNAIQAVQGLSNIPAQQPISQLSQIAMAALTTPSLLASMDSLAPLSNSFDSTAVIASLAESAAMAQSQTGSTAPPSADTLAATAAASANASSLAALIEILGTNALDSSAAVPSPASSPTTLPQIIAAALNSLLVPNTGLSLAAAVDMLTVNQTLTHQPISNLDTVIAAVDAAVASSLTDPTDLLPALPSNLTAQTLDSVLAADLGSTSTPTATTVPSLLTQVAANIDQTTVAIGASTSIPSTTSIGTQSSVDLLSSTPVAATTPSSAAVTPAAATIVALTTAETNVVPTAPPPAASGVMVQATSTVAPTVAPTSAPPSQPSTTTSINTPNQDAVALAIANISTDPTYAATAAALYANAAIFRTQHAFDTRLPDIALAVRPVTRTTPVRAVQ